MYALSMHKDINIDGDDNTTKIINRFSNEKTTKT
jgi:hypothetical protein